MDRIIKLKPVFQERIWGGTNLNSYFGYELPSENTGECWAISAHKNGDCEIVNTEYKGKTLSWLYKNHRELFGNISNDEFPLLVKLIDAKDNLSIQVHPDDNYAKDIEGEAFGKTEAWYIVDCNEDTLLEIGHNGETKEQVKKMIEDGKWDELLNYIPIKKGDFFFIPSGTVHAICKNTLIYEIQQSSDITYRLYDYNRVDSKTGKERELHTKKSIDVIKVPQKIDETIKPKMEVINNSKVTIYADTEYFKTIKYDIDGSFEIMNKAPFMLCTILDGEATINEEKFLKGDNFIVPTQLKEIKIFGKITIIVSTL